MSASVSGSPIYTTTYTRDKLGRITTKVEMIQGVTKTYDYGYDTAGRLDTVTIDGILEADYDYDLNGNRLAKTTPGGTETGTYDDQDRMLTYAGASYTYSPNGEVMAKTEGSDVTSFGYDAFGNLLGVDLPDATAIDYVVDAKNRRIGRKVDGALTQGLLWQSQLAPIAELDGGGNLVSRFVHAARINVPDYLVKGSSTYRILTDHLGSPRLVIDTTTGAVAQRIDYDEWGVVLQDTNPGLVPFGFGGGLNTTDLTDLTRFGARDYMSTAGRWLSRDPLLFAARDPNVFNYAFSDAINFNDPDGLWVLLLGVGGNTTAGMGVDYSAGLYLGWGRNGFDAGTFQSKGFSFFGFGAGGDAFGGLVWADPCDLSGDTINVNGGAGLGSATLFLDPITGVPEGLTLGAGPGWPPVYGSAVWSSTTSSSFF